MASKNHVVSMLEDYALRRGPAGPSLSQGLGLSVDPNAFSVPSSLTQQTYGSSGAANTDYSRTSMPTPINVDDYLAKLFPQQAPAPQPGRWEKALGGVGNAIQGTYNGIMGYPGSYNRGAGGWSAIGSLVDALSRKNAPAPGTIGTATPLSEGGQIGAMQGIAGMDPGAMVAAMKMLGGSGVTAAPAAPSLSMGHPEPDKDQAGGTSDYDADNPPSAARSAVDRMVSASPMASARPVGGFNLGGTGQLAAQLRNAASPPDRSMRQAGQYRPEASAAINPSLTSVASIPTPRLSPTPTAASYMGTRAQPVLPPQQNAVMDIMNERDPMKQRAMRHKLMQGMGGGTGGGI